MRFYSSCRRAVAGLFLIPALAATLVTLHAATAESAAGKTQPAAVPVASAESKTNTVENSVVKVFSTVRYPDPYKPWSKQAPTEVTGSGVVIEGKRILSNAHVVLYASQVQVQANQAGDKISATVEAIAPGIDLAVLKLDDETFFESHPPLPRANTLPEIKEAVMAYGYPIGGTSLSITKGIVSRIEFTTYNYPVSGLRIQIDAAINPGNSGGPAVVGDKMIGLAFSHSAARKTSAISFPARKSNCFSRTSRMAVMTANPPCSTILQTFENPALRSFLKLDKSVEGVIVHKPDSSKPAYPLKEWDVITELATPPWMIKA